MSVLSLNCEQTGQDGTGMGMFSSSFTLNMSKCRVANLAKGVTWLFPVKTSKQFVSTGMVVVVQNELLLQPLVFSLCSGHVAGGPSSAQPRVLSLAPEATGSSS